MNKFLKYICLLKNITRPVKSGHSDLVYITPNAGRKAFYKNFIVVQILKGMGSLS